MVSQVMAFGIDLNNILSFHCHWHYNKDNTFYDQ